MHAVVNTIPRIEKKINIENISEDELKALQLVCHYAQLWINENPHADYPAELHQNALTIIDTMGEL